MSTAGVGAYDAAVVSGPAQEPEPETEPEAAGDEQGSD